MLPSSLAIPEWLRAYETRWVRPDLVAGLTLFAFLLPAGIGYASLAGQLVPGGKPVGHVFELAFLAGGLLLRGLVGESRPPATTAPGIRRERRLPFGFPSALVSSH